MISFKFKLKILAPVNNFYFQSVFQPKKSFLSGVAENKKCSISGAARCELDIVSSFFGGAFSSICDKPIGILPVQRHLNMVGLCAS